MSALVQEFSGVVWRLHHPGSWTAELEGLRVVAEQDYSNVRLHVFGPRQDCLGSLTVWLREDERKMVAGQIEAEIIAARERALARATEMMVTLLPQWKAHYAGIESKAPSPVVAYAGGPAVVSAYGQLLIIPPGPPQCEVRHAFHQGAKRSDRCACEKITLGRLLDHRKTA